MQWVARISQRLSACQPDETAHPPASPAACPPIPEPIKVDSARLSRTEYARRLVAGLCLYCGSAGHFIKACPARPPYTAVSTLQLDPDIFPITTASTTSHPASFCCSVCPRRLGLLGKLHIPRALESSKLSPQKSSPGALSRDHPGKTARAQAG